MGINKKIFPLKTYVIFVFREYRYSDAKEFTLAHKALDLFHTNGKNVR